jgi:glycosyltransferase family protein
MINIYIFGTGKGKQFLDRCLLSENVKICGYIDNYKSDMKFLDGIPIVKQDALCEQYDYIIITLMQYENARDSLLQEGVKEEQIISYFDFKDASNERYWEVLDGYKWRIELMWRNYTEVMMPSMDNLQYEIYSDSQYVKKDCPRIMDVDSTVALLNTERKCLARFGDNEFELMCKRLRTNYQDVNSELSVRLKEVLDSHEDNLLVAIADNYGSLERYTDDAARDIRMYMTKTVRKDHMKLLDLNRQYYDAYLSRPYIMFRDKENAKKRFDNIKKIWERQDVLIVEGEFTRFGVGNDLLKGASNVQRVIVPSKNAFERYEEIKEATRKYGKDKLILTILGPTATVLAYDLAKEDYWIIDMGQLDTEYEWYLRGATKRCALDYKEVSEVICYDDISEFAEDKNLKTYNSQIVEKIL